MELHLSQEPEADALLSRSPFALLVGMVLDQQVPLEWAFASPLELERRLGKPLDAKRVAQMYPESLAAAFSARPALHRYPGSMAARVQELAQLVVDRYRGRPEEIWTGATSGSDLLRRVKELPGFGEQKAKIFVALLGKQLGVRPEGWEAVSTPFSDSGSFRSVADITSVDTLAKVRSFKQALKASKKAQGASGNPATSAEGAAGGAARRQRSGPVKKTAGAAKATARPLKKQADAVKKRAPSAAATTATARRRSAAPAGKH